MKMTCPKRTIAFMLLTTILTGVGLSEEKDDVRPKAKTKLIQSKLKIAEGRLVTKTYRKLGISVSLPKDVLEATAWSQNWFQRDTGSKELSFSLAIIEPPLFSGVENMTIWSGNVNVFTPEQLREWNSSRTALLGWTNITSGSAKSEPFDRIETQTDSAQYVGYDRNSFRIARKGKDGCVLIAIIRRCEYTIQTGARERDLLLITNILQSVKFLEP